MVKNDKLKLKEVNLFDRLSTFKYFLKSIMHLKHDQLAHDSDIRIVEDILTEQRSSKEILFRDHIYLDDAQESMRRYYTVDESELRLKNYYEFYAKQKNINRPAWEHTPVRKIMQKRNMRLDKLFYDNHSTSTLKRSKKSFKVNLLENINNSTIYIKDIYVNCGDNSIKSTSKISTKSDNSVSLISQDQSGEEFDIYNPSFTHKSSHDNLLEVYHRDEIVDFEKQLDDRITISLKSDSVFKDIKKQQSSISTSVDYLSSTNNSMIVRIPFQFESLSQETKRPSKKPIHRISFTISDATKEKVIQGNQRVSKPSSPSLGSKNIKSKYFDTNRASNIKKLKVSTTKQNKAKKPSALKNAFIQSRSPIRRQPSVKLKQPCMGHRKKADNKISKQQATNAITQNTSNTKKLKPLPKETNRIISPVLKSFSTKKSFENINQLKYSPKSFTNISNTPINNGLRPFLSPILTGKYNGTNNCFKSFNKNATSSLTQKNIISGSSKPLVQGSSSKILFVSDTPFNKTYSVSKSNTIKLPENNLIECFTKYKKSEDRTIENNFNIGNNNINRQLVKKKENKKGLKFNTSVKKTLRKAVQLNLFGKNKIIDHKTIT